MIVTRRSASVIVAPMLKHPCLSNNVCRNTTTQNGNTLAVRYSIFSKVGSCCRDYTFPQLPRYLPTFSYSGQCVTMNMHVLRMTSAVVIVLEMPNYQIALFTGFSICMLTVQVGGACNWQNVTFPFALLQLALMAFTRCFPCGRNLDWALAGYKDFV